MRLELYEIPAGSKGRYRSNRTRNYTSMPARCTPSLPVVESSSALTCNTQYVYSPHPTSLPLRADMFLNARSNKPTPRAVLSVSYA